jgi:hypothetical protein
VKTTPKPNATKNRSGELVGPALLPPWALGLDVADEAEVGDDNSMLFGLQKEAPSRSYENCSSLSYLLFFQFRALEELEHWTVTDTLDRADRLEEGRELSAKGVKRNVSRCPMSLVVNAWEPVAGGRHDRMWESRAVFE